MLKRLICYWWGCKVMMKTYTGEKIRTLDRFSGQEVDIMLYRWEKQKFCVRCGKETTQ